MKRKNVFIIGFTISCFVFSAAAMVLNLNPNNKIVNVDGEGNTYVLNLNRSATASEISAGEMSVNTAGGSPIQFGFDSDKATASSGIVTLATYGTFFNKTSLTGLSKIEGTISSGQAIVTYGIHPDILNYGGNRIDSSTNNGEFTINLSTSSDYFKFDCFGGDCAFENLKFTYTCANPYSYNFSTDSTFTFPSEVANAKLSYKRFTYYTTTTTAHEIALRCSDGNRATGKVTITIGDGSNPTVSVGTAGQDWRIIDVGSGVYYVEIRIGAMGAGQKDNPAVNCNFRTANTTHANEMIIDPTTFNYHDGSKDTVSSLSSLGVADIQDLTTSTEAIHFYTNTHTIFMFEFRNASSLRRTNKCTLTIGDGTSPVTSGLSAGWSISYVGNGTYLVNIPVNKMGNANSGDVTSLVFRSTGSGGGPLNYADILIA